MKSVLYMIVFYSALAWVSLGLFQYFANPTPRTDITHCESYTDASLMQLCINNLAKISLTDSCKITANFKYADLYTKTCTAELKDKSCMLNTQDQKDLMNYRNGYVAQCVTGY